MNQTSYLQERSQRLHFEIINGLEDRPSVQKKAEELLGLLEDYSKRDYFAVLEKHGRQKLQNEARLRLSSIDVDLASFPQDGTLLYQVFTLLGDESRRKKAEVLARKEYENTISYYKYILEGFPEGRDEILAREDFNKQLLSKDIKTICFADLTAYFQSPSENTIMNRIALWEYCFYPAQDYDNKLDKEISEIFKTHLSCNRDTRDLFHTDHTYIIDHLAKDLEGGVKDADYWKASHRLESIRLRYILRGLYPKASFNDKDKSNYRMQRILFDRVLFNKIVVFRDESDTYTKGPSPSYWEPETLLNLYLDIIPHKSLAKSEWIGLYLASKELEIDRFQQLFRTISKKDQAYKKSTLEVFYNLSIRRSDTSDEFKEAVKQNLCGIDQNLGRAPSKLDDACKTLFKGLLFICMWEKSSYSPFSQKELEEQSLEDHPSPEEGLKASMDYYNKTELHKLFMETPIEGLSAVLKEASKLLKMSEEGFDYSFFDLESEITDSSDYISLLFSFSRIERESKPALISVLNLLRERQLEYLPIIEDKKVIKEHQRAAQAIDTGFSIPYFKATFYPLDELKSLENNDLDRYIYTQKTVKFICESDRIYTGDNKSDVNWLESNRKALHMVYLYKIRNQASHFAEDENVVIYEDPKKAGELLLILIEAFALYKGLTEERPHGWEREEFDNWMLKHRPFGIIAPSYLCKHIEYLIKILCLTADRETLPELAPLAMEAGKEQSFEKLEGYIKDKGANKISLPSLTEEKIKSIASKLIADTDFYGVSFRNNCPIDLAQHYLTYLKEILRDTLRFLFSSEVLDYYDRTQENSFLKTYHAESAFYMLYLAPKLFNNPKTSQNKE